MTMWSPLRTSARMVVTIALIPEANSTQSSAPSNAASRRSATFSVGLPYRPYSNRSFPPFVYASISLLSLNTYVEVCTIGVVTESA